MLSHDDRHPVVGALIVVSERRLGRMVHGATFQVGISPDSVAPGHRSRVRGVDPADVSRCANLPSSDASAFARHGTAPLGSYPTARAGCGGALPKRRVRWNLPPRSVQTGLSDSGINLSLNERSRPSRLKTTRGWLATPP